MSSDKIRQLHLAAQKLINQGQLKLAHGACSQILSIEPKHADAHFLLGMIALNMQQMTKAIGLINVALTASPDNAEYHAFYARALVLVNRYQEASDAVNTAIALGSNKAVVNDTIGVVLSRMGLHVEALVAFNKAIDIDATTPTYFYNLAASLKFIGKFKEAKAAYDRVISLQPNYYAAYSALAELQLATKKQNHIQRIQEQLDIVAGNVEGQLHLCHAMAKELECLGAFEKALEFLTLGNQAKKQQIAYNIKSDEKLFDSIKQWHRTYSKENRLTGHLSKTPIFVLGMPRSGTTLVDRIISSHSAVVSAGELQHFAVEAKKLTKTKSRQVLDSETIDAFSTLDFSELGASYLRSTASFLCQGNRVVDKMPLNFLYIGLIKKALPNAKIILLKRHAVDVCLSNFRTLFATSFSYYNYSYDLTDCGRYYALFDNLMEYWKSEFADELLEVSYEALVEQPERQTRNILNYLELPWEESCLNFHENPSPVSTASSVQVRKPMNSSSIGRWQKYGNQLDELVDFLMKQKLIEH